MKKQLLSAIMLLAIILLMVAFDLRLDDSAPIAVREGMAGQLLYICPAASKFWDPMALGFIPYSRYIAMIFFFGAIVVTFMWGWALYQNLLKDEFKKDSFTNPWGFTKILFWAAIAMTLVLYTPNRYRRVIVDGRPGEWVLCENTTPGAAPILAEKVHAN